MSQSTLDKISLLFQKKKEELQVTSNNNQNQNNIQHNDKQQQQNPNNQAQKGQDQVKLTSKSVQMQIIDDFKELKDMSGKNKMSKKIKKKEKSDNGYTQSYKSSKHKSENQPIPKEEKNQNTIRQIAGVIWEDATMADWDTNDYRLFVGNLGNEVVDTVLANAFRKYTSFKRARVIRDKRSLKTKGYGFVSLGDPDDYLKCFREMNGQYVGNRPCKLEAGKWKDRSYEYKKDDDISAKFKRLNKKKNVVKGFGRY